MNSSTHKNDWMCFLRQAAESKRQRKDEMPRDLAKEFLNNKLNLFNVWYNSGKDWGKVGHTGMKLGCLTTMSLIPRRIECAHRGSDVF